MSDLFQRVTSPFFSNKFLKHDFNIALKLNNHTWKKYKISFVVQKMTPKCVISQSWKKFKSTKMIVFKKNPSSLFAKDKIFKAVYENFLKINGSQDI